MSDARATPGAEGRDDAHASGDQPPATSDQPPSTERCSVVPGEAPKHPAAAVVVASRSPENVLAALRATSALAAAIWLGGIVALGAIAAPAVFSIAPAPWSGDAMTVAFRRLDRVALTCAMIVLACELAAARIGTTKLGKVDLVRGAAALLAAALAALVGAWASPRIEALHHAGAIRGLGDLGEDLDRVHHWAEFLGKSEVALLALYVVLGAWSLNAARAPTSNRSDGSMSSN